MDVFGGKRGHSWHQKRRSDCASGNQEVAPRNGRRNRLGPLLNNLVGLKRVWLPPKHRAHSWQEGERVRCAAKFKGAAKLSSSRQHRASSAAALNFKLSLCDQLICLS